jgi:hypothetical protein
MHAVNELAQGSTTTNVLTTNNQVMAGNMLHLTPIIGDIIANSKNDQSQVSPKSAASHGYYGDDDDFDFPDTGEDYDDVDGGEDYYHHLTGNSAMIHMPGCIDAIIAEANSRRGR